MTLRLLQLNCNHARQAQDALIQTIREHAIAIAIIAEPYNILQHPCWLGDTAHTVAIIWQPDVCSGMCTLLHSGPGYVIVDYDDMIIVGCYASPNRPIVDLEAYLDAIGDLLTQYQSRPILLAGDLNGKAIQWGSPRTDARGALIIDWLAAQDLRVLNQGSISTCVRWQGESIVDITVGSPVIARRLINWRVADEIDSLSDHQYIIMELALTPQTIQRTNRRKQARDRFPKWGLTKLNHDLAEAAALIAEWCGIPDHVQTTEDRAVWLRTTMQRVCDTAMPRVRASTLHSVFWWSSDLAQLRRTSVACGRLFARARKRRESQNELDRKYLLRKQARQKYKRAILAAKARSWEDLRDTLNGDPWGRPYRIVLGKLAARLPPICELMDPVILETVLAKLFPQYPPVAVTSTAASMDCPPISEMEFAMASKRLRGAIKAPGPDGVPGRAWTLAMPYLGKMVVALFDDCLRHGSFPQTWKLAKLVLLKKAGRPDNQPSSYRPLCLIDDLAKVFEKVIADRIVQHLITIGPDLSPEQFGFRRGHSTIDAVSRVRSLAREMVSHGGVAIAVSLDIVNAFNTLPWETILRSLERYALPAYLQAILTDYLRDRCMCYVNRDGVIKYDPISCGVPQGSVLGPLLWDLTYDQVLRVPLPMDCRVICYADDTCILAGGHTLDDAIASAELGTSCIIRAVKKLGLNIATHKTEAIAFGISLTTSQFNDARISIDGDVIKIGKTMKYLGILLDSTWSFQPHFDMVIPRTERVMMALGRIMPNLRGPDERVRRLYVEVLHSILLYGSPIWADKLARSKKTGTLVRRIQRQIAIRVIRAYRTVSMAAATALARVPPLDMIANARKRVYDKIRDLKTRDCTLTARAVDALKLKAQREMITEWLSRLQDPYNPGRWTLSALIPHFTSWISRSHGQLTFRMTQVLTGHGCYGKYLHRIGKVPTPCCEHCSGALDSAHHTLSECTAWSAQRTVLQATIGTDLALTRVVQTILESAEKWSAFALFCESVMMAKEGAERERQAAARHLSTGCD